MIRLFFFIIVVFFAAFAFGWLAQRPGLVILEWQWLGEGGYEITLITFALSLAAFVVLAILLWSILMFIVRLPNYIRNKQQQRKLSRGFEMLAKTIIALKAGETKQATKMLKQAKKYVPNNNLLPILESENALLQGDIKLAKEKYQKMLENAETKLMALHELYKIAISEKETQEAQSLAVQAYELSPKVLWSAQAALFASAKLGQFNRAISILEKARDYNLYEKSEYARKKAVLLVAQAQRQESGDWQNALILASQAHRLAADLVPAATLLARLYIRQGKNRKATKTLLATWELSKHPDLAHSYVYIAASARERLKRANNLIKQGKNYESLYVLALAAVEAREWQTARKTLEKLLKKNETKKACLLMADLEQAENNDKGKMQFWLNKANTASEYAWVYKNYIEKKWQPSSPIDGELDVFQWQLIDSNIAQEKIIESNHIELPEIESASEPSVMEHAKSISQGNKENFKETLLNKTSGLPIHAPDDPGSKSSKNKKKKKKNFFFYG